MGEIALQPYEFKQNPYADSISLISKQSTLYIFGLQIMVDKKPHIRIIFRTWETICPCVIIIVIFETQNYFSNHLTLRQFFLKKMKIFGNFFRKNFKFLAIFLHSNGNFPEGQVRTVDKENNEMITIEQNYRNCHREMAHL